MWQRVLARLTGVPAAPRLHRCSVKAPFGADLLKNQNVRVYSAVQKSSAACEIRVIERPADQPEDRTIFAALEAVGVPTPGASSATTVVNSQPKEEKSTKLDAVIVNLAAAPTSPALISAVAREFSGSILAALNPCASVLVVARNDTLDLSGGHMGLAAFVRSLSRELGPRGVRVNMVVPKVRLEPECTCLVTLGCCLLFLLSKKSAYITGQCQLIDVSNRTPVHAKPTATRNLFPLHSKRLVVVTGAARGIGKAIADAFAAEGADVIRVDRAPSITNAPGGVCADICSAEGRSAVAAAVQLRNAGGACGVDVVVHNAGITRDRTLGRMCLEEWESVMHVNMEAILALNAAVPWAASQDRRGTAIVMSSISGLAGNFGQTNYATTKGVLMGWAAAGCIPAADSVQAHQSGSFRCIAVAPGFIQSDMTAKMPRLMRTIAARSCSLLQGGTPEDVASAVVYLASEAGSRAFHGECVRVCGGNVVGADNSYMYRSKL